MGRCMRWCSTLLALATLGAPPSLSARSAILVDGHSGQVLYQKDAYRPRPPASLTKILTAVLAAEHERFGEAVTISRRAASVPGAQLQVRAGDQVRFESLLEAMLLLSANDASVALAEHLAGSVEDFADLMNGRARELGATGSRFQNPHGLTQADHHTTAFDLALLARYALRDPLLSRLVAAREGQARELHGRWERHLRNTNRFLWSYPSADGVKTGTTAAAGRCLIASATRDGHRLLAVLLNAGDRYRDAAAILDWGFANFARVLIVPRDALVATVTVDRGEVGRLNLMADRDLRVVVPRGREGAVDLVVWSPDRLQAPVRPGEVVGRVEAVLEGEVLGEALLVASAGVRCRSPVRWLLNWLLLLLRGLVLRGLGEAGGGGRRLHQGGEGQVEVTISRQDRLEVVTFGPDGRAGALQDVGQRPYQPALEQDRNVLPAVHPRPCLIAIETGAAATVDLPQAAPYPAAPRGEDRGQPEAVGIGPELEPVVEQDRGPQFARRSGRTALAHGVHRQVGAVSEVKTPDRHGQHPRPSCRLFAGGQSGYSPGYDGRAASVRLRQ